MFGIVDWSWPIRYEDLNLQTEFLRMVGFVIITKTFKLKPTMPVNFKVQGSIPEDILEICFLKCYVFSIQILGFCIAVW